MAKKTGTNHCILLFHQVFWSRKQTEEVSSHITTQSTFIVTKMFYAQNSINWFVPVQPATSIVAPSQQIRGHPLNHLNFITNPFIIFIFQVSSNQDQLKNERVNLTFFSLLIAKLMLAKINKILMQNHNPKKKKK